ncbi:hypothetical protein PDB1_05743 [Pseudomonas aeruginosa]
MLSRQNAVLPPHEHMHPYRQEKGTRLANYRCKDL